MIKTSVIKLQGDCRDILPTLPDKSVHCCVTSPPYWKLRDYGEKKQIGLEPTVEEFVVVLVDVFREVKRVLRDDGTLWLNLGDCYAGSGCGPGKGGLKRKKRSQSLICGGERSKTPPKGLKPKDLIGVPWRVALALQADGWYLRQDIIWHKPNPMPESVRDRCTKSHEYIFLLSKSAKYFYDFEAIKEPVSGTAHMRRPKDTGVGFGYGTDKKKRKRQRIKNPSGWETGKGSHGSFHKEGRRKPGVGPKTARAGCGIKANESFQSAMIDLVDSRNKRSVWTVPTQAYSKAHFATFPEKLIEPCILAGCPRGGTVLDPFGGSGTTGKVAIKHQRKAILIELNPQYIVLQEQRTSNVQINLF